MVKETGFALVLMIVVAAFSADGQAAVLAEWLLDESQITVDVTTAADTTGNYDGTYLDTAFFGGAILFP